MAQSTPGANRLWADLIVEELVRNGVSCFYIAPGSRSTPLVAALANNQRAETVIHYDERGAAFGALGYARATGRPAAWITTSGTAVANGLPAVVEAATDAVPIILLTADRPPELRQTGANQTIVQPNIFGEYVRWSFDLPAPDPEIDPAMVLTTVDQAVYRAHRAPKGPVHLNLMFREPFLPDAGTETSGNIHSTLTSWKVDGKPYTRYAATRPAVDRSEIEDLWDELRRSERGLILAGRLESQEQGEAVLQLANAIEWPLLPDVGSRIRLGKTLDSEQRACHYDILLADEDFAASHEPEAVLHIGGGTVSKRLQRFLAKSRSKPYIVVRENPFRLDPNHQATHSVETGITGFCRELAGIAESRSVKSDPSWTTGWREASERVGLRLAKLFAGMEKPNEPLVASLISRLIPKGHGLCLANSMPVRDMDTFATADGASVPVAANRGASGIDGTVATAAGFARGSGGPVTLLIGDLALLHDLNSLAMFRDIPAVIVALNNDGGGIFSFLPVSRHQIFFEPYFGTPHGLDFEHAAAMFGFCYEQPKTTSEFIEAYRGACSRSVPTLIEVRTDREENRALHERLLEQTSSALED